MTSLTPPADPKWPARQERRGKNAATPGQPFGRRTSDDAFFRKAYPAAFVAQVAAASPVSGQSMAQSVPAGPNPYARRARLGLVANTRA